MLNYRYEIINEIGEGRSRVFLCYDELLQSRVALKVLSGNAAGQEKKDFYNEYFLLKKFNHPSIIKAFDCGAVLTADNADKKKYLIEQNDVFFSMEYFEGETLDKSLDSFDQEKLYILIDSISSVLFYLHQSNFIYYDLKPENILLGTKENSNKLKFIDFGLTSHMLLKKERNILGSLKYIAPEILNHEARNHQADLYSLGVLLYRIIYRKFPFDYEDPVEIYRAQLEGKIDFPKTEFNRELIKSVQTLLQKRSYSRYDHTLLLLGDLGIPLSENYIGSWNYPKVFAGRTDLMNSLNNYLEDQSDYKPYQICGPSDSGKSFLLKELRAKHRNSILITSRDLRPGMSPGYQLLKLVSFNDVVFNQLPAELKNEIMEYIAAPGDTVSEDYRKLFARISEAARFILLFDDVHKFEPITIDMLTIVAPVLLVNSVKIIYSEPEQTGSGAHIFPNSHIADLELFSEPEVLEFLRMSFAYFFPQNEIYELILKYSDLHPGSIYRFIEVLVHNKMLILDSGKGVQISVDSSAASLLKRTMTEKFSSLYINLDKTENKIIDYVSLIRKPVSEDDIKEIMDLPLPIIQSSLKSLGKKNILKFHYADNTFEIQSRSLADYISSRTESSEQIHREIARWMISSGKGGGYSEIAYHLEQARHYPECFSYYYMEISKARVLSANNYAIGILDHLLKLPLEKSKMIRVKADLSELNYLIGNFQVSHLFILELLDEPLPEQDRKMFLIQNGLVMIQMGSSREGIDLLEPLIEQIEDDNKRNEIIASIADAYLYLNDFEKASALCRDLVERKNTDAVIRGKALTLSGLIELYEKNSPASAIERINAALDLYKAEKLTQHISAAKINIGNLYVMLGDYEAAKSNWNDALALNKSIGNLEQEANLLLNYGVLYYDLAEYEIAIDQYKRAKIIFESLGNRNALGLTLMNLAEVHYIMCSYSEVSDLLNQSRIIFLEMENMMEYAEVLFITGKFRYSLGDTVSLKEAVIQLNELSEMNILTEPLLLKLKLLEGLLYILENKKPEAIEILTESVENFSALDERDNNYNYSIASFQLVNVLMKCEKFDDAEKTLDRNKLADIAGKNNIISIERDYWLARLLLRTETKDAHDHIDNALFKLQGISISNLSWQVTFLAGIYYEKRGNPLRAEKFFYLTNALILEITGRITGDDLKEMAINQTDVKTALDHIKAFSDLKTS